MAHLRVSEAPENWKPGNFNEIGSDAKGKICFETGEVLDAERKSTWEWDGDRILFVVETNDEGRLHWGLLGVSNIGWHTFLPCKPMEEGSFERMSQV